MKYEGKTIFIVGTGQIPTKHMTLEGVSVCKNAKKLLLINGDSQAVLDAIHGHQNYEDIMSLYVDGAIDDDNYKRIVSKILAESNNFDSIAVTTAGHPLVGVSWWERLRRSSGFCAELRYIEGISSLTGMFVDLNIDPLESGTTILDVNRFLIFDQEINPEFDLYIFNICSTGTRRTNISNPAKDNQLLLLKNHLLKFYPAATIIKLISSKYDDRIDSKIRDIELSSLELVLPEVKFYSSLFLPAIKPKRVNRDFVRLLLDI